MKYDISKHYPDIVQDIREFQEYAKMVNPELTLSRQALEQILKNQFMLTCDETGIARYERWLKITPPATATLEERRLAVFTAWNASTPFTERKLIQMLDALCTRENYIFLLSVAAYHLEVHLQLEVKHTKKTVEELLEKVVPENMELVVRLIVNTHGNLNQWRYTHKELHAHRHGDIPEAILRR